MTIWLVGIAGFILGALLGAMAARQAVVLKVATIEVQASNPKDVLTLFQGAFQLVKESQQPANYTKVAAAVMETLRKAGPQFPKVS